EREQEPGHSKKSPRTRGDRAPHAADDVPLREEARPGGAHPGWRHEREEEEDRQGEQRQRPELPLQAVRAGVGRLLTCHRTSGRKSRIPSCIRPVRAPGYEPTGVWESVMVRSCRIGTMSWVSTRAQKARSSDIPAISTARPERVM